MSDLISRQAAIELIHSLYPSAPIMRMNRKRWEEKNKPYIETEKALEMLPSVQSLVLTCDGCRHVGTYDTDFPCSGCIRREKDYYEQER